MTAANDTIPVPRRMRSLPLDKHGRVEESWLPIRRFDGFYEVSNLGHVRSLRSGGLILKPDAHRRWGHQRVRLALHGRNSRRMVHELVLEAFVGPRPPGLCVRHLDGDPSNNIVSNLAWGTMLENHADRERHGRTARGERHGKTKLTDVQRAEIRQAVATGETQESLAIRYSVHVSTIWRVVHRRDRRCDDATAALELLPREVP